MVNSYRDLDVWNRSMELVEMVYLISKELPDTERFGLITQMQRAAVSIPSNIAEGYGRGGGNYRSHVLIAKGSLMELETQLELCVRLQLIKKDRVLDCWKASQDVGRMLTKLSLALVRKK
ncbi:four helix bundle protein [Rubinisphaera sp.]|uniref:four helix bundle protein n=1 Tax=Rubinisphaera sp. TaxID=2024857 RepID=UPI000C0F6885|nr:four helix bundle protein [Rubinisphaera sp.]MBV10878.1 four helix bundle protein [Rubinisphaera sp.]HCS54802.1 four helix bundle protein [Planctomycetaceae bacterium]|tara:strand:+ start:7938 stop:8297 length:360 start_codon:yes stop_codon:yes gene_type:complete